MVVIRMKRIGTKKRPYYRIVVSDSREARGAQSIEEIGYYRPMESAGEQFVVKADKVKEWVAKGAQPSDTVRKLLNNNKIYL